MEARGEPYIPRCLGQIAEKMPDKFCSNDCNQTALCVILLIDTLRDSGGSDADM